MLSLWGNADSVNVQKVLWCCEELGLACRRIDAQLARTTFVGGEGPLSHLQRWFDALAARPAYRKVVMLPLT